MISGLSWEYWKGYVGDESSQADGGCTVGGTDGRAVGLAIALAAVA